MSPHWTDTKNQSNVDLIRPKIHIKVNIMLDYLQFYHYIKEKKDGCRQFREVLFDKKQKEQNYPTVTWGQEKHFIVIFTKYKQ